MEPRLSESIQKRLETALNTWKNWHPEPVSRPDVLGKLSGETNDSFLLQLNSRSDQAVLRLNSSRSIELGIDRERERKVLDSLSQSELAPASYYVGQDFLVSEYINGEPLNKKELTENNLRKLAENFRCIHQIHVHIESRLSLTEELQRFYELIRNDVIKGSLIEIHLSILELATDTTNTRSLHQESLSLCHHDLLLDNLILSNQKVRVIDWEYANLGDPMFDLAVFIESSGLGNDQRNLFLQSYGEPFFSDLIRNYQTIYRYLELLWWLVRDQKMTPIIQELLEKIEKR